MKANINGINVEGTPDEIVTFKLKLSQQNPHKNNAPKFTWHCGDDTELKKWDSGIVDSGSETSIKIHVTNVGLDKD